MVTPSFLRCSNLFRGITGQTIRLTGAISREGPIPWRRLAYRDAATGKRYVFLTHHFKPAAQTIADICTERRQKVLALKCLGGDHDELIGVFSTASLEVTYGPQP